MMMIIIITGILYIYIYRALHIYLLYIIPTNCTKVNYKIVQHIFCHTSTIRWKST